MSRALKKFGFDVFPRFDSYDDYLTHLCDTKYLLCPNGNTTSDTLRLYEALACGCIPITEKTWFTDYIKTLFANKYYPTCPLRSYSTWNHAFNDILRDTLDSSTYQANIQDWWDDLASLLPQLCHNFISSNLISEPFKPSYTSFFFRLVMRFKNLLWLISMQKLSTLLIRLAQTILRLKFSR